jgi:hypothetical protein
VLAVGSRDKQRSRRSLEAGSREELKARELRPPAAERRSRAVAATGGDRRVDPEAGEDAQDVGVEASVTSEAVEVHMSRKALPVTTYSSRSRGPAEKGIQAQTRNARESMTPNTPATALPPAAASPAARAPRSLACG